MKYVIVGGGTAGWLTALYVKKTIPYSDVTVVASSEIGILGAGEGTTPQFINFLKTLDISPQDIITNAKGTVKTGINFTNWNGDGETYFHPFFFGEQLTALHFDANLLAKYLETIALERGITLVDDIVDTIVTDNKQYIKTLNLKSGNIVNVDFVFDCSGFKRLIIGNFYKSKWISYSDKLPVKKAMPFFIHNDNINLPEYTEAIAMKHGWIWKIPVQGRYGCGYVFDSDFTSDKEIHEEIEEYFGYKIDNTKTFEFNAGCYEKIWINNCIAIGLSAGFTEPLEATSIWITVVLLSLIEVKIDGIISKNQKSIQDFNSIARNLNEEISRFLHFHYLSKRNDSKFWQTFRDRNKSPEFILALKDFKKLSEHDLRYLNLVFSVESSYDRIESFSSQSWDTVGNGIKFYEN